MDTENNLQESTKQALTIPVVSGSTCFAKNSFALVEHTNNDTDEKRTKLRE